MIHEWESFDRCRITRAEMTHNSARAE
jgi:hypothetical protein